jgi:hypothetical protein
MLVCWLVDFVARGSDKERGKEEKWNNSMDQL